MHDESRIPKNEGSSNMTIAAILEASVPVRKAILAKSPAQAAATRCSTLCSTCALRSTCLPCGLPQHEAGDFDQLVYSRRRIRRGEHLYHAGDTFTSLYAFRLGFFKS